MADAANTAHKAQRACGPNSFIPGTKVLMADGTTKPIEDIKVGDKVVATDPVSGETAAKTVVGAIATQGQKDLVKLTVDTDGTAGDNTGTIVATAAHPIWAPEGRRRLTASAVQGEELRDARGGATGSIAATDRHPFQVVGRGEWVEARELKPGDEVRTLESERLSVVKTRMRRVGVMATSTRWSSITKLARDRMARVSTMSVSFLTRVVPYVPRFRSEIGC